MRNDKKISGKKNAGRFNFKSFISGALAVAMLAGNISVCAPSLTFAATKSNVSYDAADTSSVSDVITDTLGVSIMPAEHGLLKFADAKDSFKSYSEGDRVVIYSSPESGYAMGAVTVTTKSGEAVSNTAYDNHIEFTMPSENVVVNANFETSDTNNSETAVDNTATDIYSVIAAKKVSNDYMSTKNYVTINANSKYVNPLSDDFESVDVLTIANTIADKKLLSYEETVDSMFVKDSGAYSDALISSDFSYVMVYDIDKSSNYYVALANNLRDSNSYVSDAIFTYNNTNGEVINDCIYDAKTGLVYIPKKYTTSASRMQVKLQLLNVTEDNSLNSYINLKVDSDMKTSLTTGVYEIDSAMPAVGFNLGNSDIKSDNISVKLDETDMNPSTWTYDEKNSILSLHLNGASANNIKITIKKDGIVKTGLSMISGLFTETVRAGDYGDLDATGVTITAEDDLSEGSWCAISLDNFEYGNGLSNSATSGGWYVVANDIDATVALTAFGRYEYDSDGEHHTYTVEGDGGNVNEPSSANKTVFVSYSEQDITLNGVKATITAGSHYLGCAHSEAFSFDGDSIVGPTNTTENPSRIVMRVLRVYDGYVLVGLASPQHSTQSGGAALLLRYSVTPKVGSIDVSKSVDKNGYSGSNLPSIAGAQFTAVKNDDENVTHTWTIGADGSSDGAWENAPLGTYTITETSVPSGYSAAAAQTVTVSKDSLTATASFSDKLKVGNFVLSKVSGDPDATNNNSAYSLGGAVYTLVGEGDSYTLTTNNAGKTGVTNIKCGTYVLTEISMSKGFKLAAGNQTITIGEGSSASVSATSVEPPEYGDISLTKYITADNNSADCNLNWLVNTDNYRTSNAKYKLTNTATNQEYKVTIGDDGKGHLNTIPLGEYIVKEIEAPFNCKLDTTSHNISLRFDTNYNNQTKKAHAYLDVYDVPIYDPVAISLYKKDESGNIWAQGDANLGGAKFRITYYSNPDLTPADIASGNYTPLITLVEQTVLQDNGIYGVNMSKAYQDRCLVSFESKIAGLTSINDMYDKQNDIVFPVGTVCFEEIDASEGYLVSGSTITANVFGFDKNGRPIEVAEIKNDPNYPYICYNVNAANGKTTTNITVTNYSNTAEVPQKGGVKVQKLDSSSNTFVGQGNAEIGATYTIYNKSANPIFIDYEDGSRREFAVDSPILTITTDENGVATTGEKVLPYGTYEVRESSTSNDYTVVPYSRTFEIRQDGQMVDLTNDPSKNDVNRGGVQVQKFSADLVSTMIEGDCFLRGAQYTIKNMSKNAVYINGRAYAPGEDCLTIETDIYGIAKTDDNTLPIGTYQIRETRASDGYLINTDWVKTFSVTAKGQMVAYSDIKVTDTNNESDLQGNAEYPIRGGVYINKADYDRIHHTPDGDETVAQGDASLAGAEFYVKNESAFSVKVNGNIYAPGEVVAVLTTDADGHAETTNDALPYGTYSVTEHSASTGYLVDEEYTYTIYVRENGKMYKASDYSRTNTAIREPVQRGGIEIQKIDAATNKTEAQGDASLSEAKYEITNKSALPVYVNGNWYGNGDVVMTVTTDMQGVAKTGNNVLPYGTYSVREISPSGGYHLNNTWSATVEVRGNEKIYKVNTDCPETVIRGGLSVYKNDAQMSDVQGDASLAGAVLSITNKSVHSVVVNGVEYGVDDVVMSITTDENGFATTGATDLPYGTYEITEHLPSTGYRLNSDWSTTVQVRSEGVIAEAKSTLPETIIRGGVKLQKNDADTQRNEPQGDASLAGAQFVVENASAHPVITMRWDEEHQRWIYNKWAVGDTIDVITTDENGVATLDGTTLSYGTYKLREIKSSTGYYNNDEWTVTFSIRQDGQIVDISYNPCPETVVRGDVMIYKYDIEHNGSVAIGGSRDNSQDSTTLSGITFEITNESKHSVVVDGKEYNVGAAVATITTHWNEEKNAYTAETTGNKLPWGTYSVREISTNETYKQADDSKLTFEIRGAYTTDVSNVSSENHSNQLIFKNRVVRGDVRMVKIAEFSSDRMQTAWVIKNLSTNEEHVVVTDKNGEFYSSAIDGNKHTANTNVNDKFLNQIHNGEQINFADLDVTSGVWFGASDSGNDVVSTADDNYGALPYGKYEIYEIRTDTNVNYNLQDFEFYIYKDAVTVDLGTVTDYKVELSTVALDGATNIHLGNATQKASIVDTVTYRHLTEGHEYTMAAALVDALNGAHIVAKQDDGSYAPVTATKTFTATSSVEGTVEMLLTFDATSLAGHSVVVTETVYDSHDNKLTVHNDLTDEQQTIVYPFIMTKAVSLDTDSSESIVEKHATIKDTVTYENLIVGRTYKVKGILMDKNTHDELLDANGHEIEATAEFMAETENGTVDVTFKFDSSNLAGTTAVVFETLEFGGLTIGVHADFDDGNQTIYFPKITTMAHSTNNSDELMASDNTTIVDDVEYSNVVYGDTYTLTSELIKKSDASRIASQEISFVAAGSSGRTYVTFNVDASTLAGEDVVVYQTLSKNGKTIVEHKDIDNEDQTVHFPKISTVATYGDTDMHEGMASESSVIKDTVTYKNLRAGETYKLVGTLNDKDSGAQVGRNASVEFTAEADGTANVEFTMDASRLVGHTLVVYETLYHGDNVVASHRDINDENQTVRFPEISTSISSSVDSNVVENGTDIVLTDTVTYKNLIAGTEYVVTGRMMDKSTSDEVESIKAESVRFTPTSSDGTVDVKFTVTDNFSLDDTGIDGKELVCFETLAKADKQLAVHADINDEKQTVYIPEIKIPDISTKATYGDTTVNEGKAVENAVIKDEVSYKYLKSTRTYTVNGELVDATTGAKTGITASKTFVPSKEEDTVTVEFNFDATSYAGRTLVAYETILYDGQTISGHTDIHDEDQSVNFPEIKTVLTEKTTGFDEIAAAGEVTLVDKVSYKNVKAGKSYKMIGVIVDKDTKDEISGTEPVVVDFVPADTDGIVNVEFTIDASKLAGKSVVAFEGLYRDKAEIATHADINDANQTVTIPKISTTAVDSQTGIKIVASGDSVKITDTISYENLVVGRSYDVHGKLMDKATGSVASNMVIGSNGSQTAVPIEVSTSFVPSTANGTVDVEFTVDSSQLADMDLVAYETLSRLDVVLAEHKDINDESQTVYVPSISTKATYGDTGTQEGEATKATKITDAVTYNNLQTGVAYTLTAKLYNSATGAFVKDANDNTLVTTKTFTPTAKNGTENVDITFDASDFAGSSVVVYETLSYNNIVVASHEDANDESQTVKFPEIKTVLADTNSKYDEIEPSEKVSLTDTVSYKNLTVGNVYTIVGVLMDKTTGKVLTSSDGKSIGASAQFKADKTDGEQEVVFEIDGSALAGKSIVAYEALSNEKGIVARHEDIDDADQTVSFPDVKTIASASGSTDKNIYVSNAVKLQDMVFMSNLVAGRTYMITGTAIDKTTGKPVVDADGKNIVSSVQFVASDTYKKDNIAKNYVIPDTDFEYEYVVPVEFSIDTRDFAGKDIVFYEVLSAVSNDGSSIDIFNDVDINNANQTVTVLVPEIKTVATDATTGTHMIAAVENTAIIDTITYKNLAPGVSYTATATLAVDEENCLVWPDTNEFVTGSAVFVPDTSEGTATVKIDFNGSYVLAEGKAVVFESITCDGKEIASHADFNDADQTVYKMSISTMATGDDKRSKSIDVKEDAVIIDTISYSNVQPGVEYYIQGQIINKRNSAVLATVDASFVPEESNGTVDVEFTIDTTIFESATLVAFETITDNNGNVLAEHKDIDDDDQSVVVRTISTPETAVHTMAGRIAMIAIFLVILLFGMFGFVEIKRKIVAKKIK